MTDQTATPQRRSLEEWAQDWPYMVEQHANGGKWTPLGMGPDCDQLYKEAFNLTDYFVSSITGGSMWFAPRKRKLSASGMLDIGEEIRSRGTE